jgi:hypothetical protein
MLSLRIRWWACVCSALVATPVALAAPQIYRCDIAGVSTYQDRPCTEDSVPYEPDIGRVSTYDPPPATAARSAARKPRKRNSATASSAQAQAKRAEECRRIGASLREIKAKMRTGYDAREGERLRARKLKLDERRRAHKCG